MPYLWKLDRGSWIPPLITIWFSGSAPSFRSRCQRCFLFLPFQNAMAYIAQILNAEGLLCSLISGMITVFSKFSNWNTGYNISIILLSTITTTHFLNQKLNIRLDDAKVTQVTKDNLNLLTQFIALVTILHYLSNKAITDLAKARKEPVKNLSGLPFYPTRGKEPTMLNYPSFKNTPLVAPLGGTIYTSVSMTHYICWIIFWFLQK